jgi:hypothetical protein
MLVRRLSLIAALIMASPVWAGYAMLTPPAPLVLQAGGTTTVAYGNIAAANAPRIAGGYVLANATLNTGAKTIIVPVAMRVAGNAAVFAVTKLNPYVAAASLVVGAYSLAREWFGRDEQLPHLDIDADGHIYIPGVPVDPGFGEYQYMNSSGVWVSIYTLAGLKWQCNDLVNYQGVVTTVAQSSLTMGGSCGYEVQGVMRTGNVGNFYCNTGWVSGGNAGSQQKTNGICLADGGQPSPTPGVDSYPTPERLESLSVAPISASLLPYLSPDIPVEPIPVINPATQPVGDPLIGPELNPAPAIDPAPFRVPNGDSVPIPNTNPQQYSQPWLEITPAPTLEEPWRVDVIQIITIELNPIIQPNPPFVQQLTDCDKYPGALSCSDLDDPDDEEVPRETRHIELQDGPSFAGGSCPADLVISAAGHSFNVFDASVACGWVLAARPVILFLAALSALTIIRPGGRKVRAVTVDD